MLFWKILPTNLGVPGCAAPGSLERLESCFACFGLYCGYGLPFGSLLKSRLNLGRRLMSGASGLGEAAAGGSSVTTLRRTLLLPEYFEICDPVSEVSFFRSIAAPKMLCARFFIGVIFLYASVLGGDDSATGTGACDRISKSMLPRSILLPGVPWSYLLLYSSTYLEYSKEIKSEAISVIYLFSKLGLLFIFKENFA